MQEGERSSALTSHGPGVHIDTTPGSVPSFPHTFFNDSTFFKQSESSSSCNGSSGSWLCVICGVILTRLLCFVLELFLANTCLHAFVWALQTSGQTAGFK